ncbi:MAG: elongation factor Tu [Bradyrhizobium sp.]|jgi:hypothetical protein|nr:elongation factor Tu [Bradyrhizobium sp.]
MAYTLVCRIGLPGDGYAIRIIMPDGRDFERRLLDTDLVVLDAFDFSYPGPELQAFAAELRTILFGGAEALLDEAIAQGKLEADRLTRVLLEIASDRLEPIPWELAALGAAGPDFEIVRSIPVIPELAGLVPPLPFRPLVANMGSPHDTTPTFPLRSVLLGIFGDAGGLTKVFQPATIAGVGGGELAGVLSHSRHDVVHLQVLTRWRNEGVAGDVMMEGPGDQPPLLDTALPPLLQKSQTRLLILHSRGKAYGRPEASQLVSVARRIVEAGGPAVLVMPFDPPHPAGGTIMLNDFYEQIVHDQPLDVALHRIRTRPSSISPRPQTAAQPMLFLGSGAEHLLRVSPLAAELRRRTGEIRQRSLQLRRRIDELSDASMLDVSEPRDILVSAGGTFDRSDQIAREIEDWKQETRGLMPLHEATVAAEQGLEQLTHVESRITELEENAARVVNCCFARNEASVPKDETLLHNAPYRLRLQIGKPWPDSVVRDAAPVPEGYLAAHSDETGIDLDICLYTEDFDLPEGDVFPLRLPRPPAESCTLEIAVTPRKAGTARLRACIYYQRNLIQSLSVIAAVTESRTEQRLDANYATVEFSMADTMIGVEKLPERTLNLLTNDNGDGSYKIAIRGTDIKLQYTLTGSTAITNVRKALLTICADVDADGKPKNYRYSDGDNSGGEAKLVADLKALAPLGWKLYVDLITDPANFTEQDPLEATLKQPGDIQVSITSSARSVYPWAMIYDRKLDSGPGVDVCPVMLGKLTGADKASSLYEGSCIDGGCAHGSDLKMICPLGFWGFRHAIEQLPWNLGTVVDSIGAKPVSLVMAVHRKLAGAAHRAEIEKASGLTAQFADVRTAITTALKSDKPHVVYFYCHGGHSDDSPWLGVGDDEQIAPGDFVAWDTRWQDTTPLVIVNGCHTVDLKPDDLLDFVKIFAWCRATGVIGTEIAIPESLAREFGRFFMGRFAKGGKEGTVAVIFRDFRLSLLAKRNVLGLAYTPYGHGDLHLTV